MAQAPRSGPQQLLADLKREPLPALAFRLSGALRIDRSQGFCLSKTSQVQLSTRHFPHGAWSFSEWPQVHIPSLPIL